MLDFEKFTFPIGGVAKSSFEVRYGSFSSTSKFMFSLGGVEKSSFEVRWADSLGFRNICAFDRKGHNILFRKVEISSSVFMSVFRCT